MARRCPRLPKTSGASLLPPDLSYAPGTTGREEHMVILKLPSLDDIIGHLVKTCFEHVRKQTAAQT